MCFKPLDAVSLRHRETTNFSILWRMKFLFISIVKMVPNLNLTLQTASVKSAGVGYGWILFIFILLNRSLMFKASSCMWLMWSDIFWLTGHQSDQPENQRPAAPSESCFESGKHSVCWSHGRSPVAHLLVQSAAEIKWLNLSEITRFPRFCRSLCAF